MGRLGGTGGFDRRLAKTAALVTIHSLRMALTNLLHVKIPQFFTTCVPIEEVVESCRTPADPNRRPGKVPQTERPRTWLGEVLSGLALASGIGYLATSYTVSVWLTKSWHRKPNQVPESLGLICEPVSCTTDDGLRLSGWALMSDSTQRPRATIAFFHGMRHNRGSMLSRMEYLVREGYRCVAFDHRAHGESQGRRTSFGFYESRDVTAVLRYVRERWPEQPCVTHGISMGAAAICFAGKTHGGPDGVILESLYHDIGKAFRSRLTSNYPPWFQRFGPGIIWLTERRTGMRLPQVVPANHIGNLAPTPVLLMTGTEDRHASPIDAERLYDRCGEPRELWLVPGATHYDLYEVGGDDYRHRILDFLRRRVA
jgi:alpha-beta hydrolase superfamily lysophospholipase